MRTCSSAHHSSSMPVITMAPPPRLGPVKKNKLIINLFYYHFIFQVLHLLAGGRRSSAITEEPPLPGPLFLPACRPFLSLPHFSLSTSPLFPLHSFFLPFSVFLSTSILALPDLSFYTSSHSAPLSTSLFSIFYVLTFLTTLVSLNYPSFKFSFLSTWPLCVPHFSPYITCSHSLAHCTSLSKPLPASLYLYF